MQPAAKPPPSKPAEQATLEHCLLALLRGIQNHSVIADGSDGQEFRAQLSALEGRFQGNENPQLVVESAVALLDKYGTQAKQAIGRQKSEGVAAAAELSEARKTLPEARRSMERLRALEKQVQALSSGDDLEAAKARLCTEIAAARAEAIEERQQIGELLGGVAGKLDTSAGATPRPVVHSADPLTGLPSRGFAEAELLRELSQPGDCYLALFVVKRLALINSKFGYSRGDQVLLKVVAHLAQSLPDFNNLYRWAPCAFLTLAPPGTTFKEIRSKIQLIEITRLTPTLEWQGRSAMVPVAIDCRIVSAKDFGTSSELFLHLDTLAADA